MSQALDVLNEVNEAAFTVKRVQAVRNGKRTMIAKRIYAGADEREGYKRDPKTGKLVKMTAQEMRARSKAAKKTAKSAQAKAKRARSLKRRTAAGL